MVRSLLFVTHTIPKLLNDKDTLKKIFENDFGSLDSFENNEHSIKFSCGISIIDDYELNNSIKKLCSNQKFTFNICNHGFVTVEVEISDSEKKFDVLKQNIEEKIIPIFMENILKNKKLYEKESTLPFNDLVDILRHIPFRTFEHCEMSSSIMDTMENLSFYYQDLLSKELENYHESIFSHDKSEKTETILSMSRVLRSYYLKLYYSDSKCNLVKNQNYLQTIIAHAGVISPQYTKALQLITNQNNRIFNQGIHHPYYFGVDIVDFTKHTDDAFKKKNNISNKKIANELDDFIILSSMINSWLVSEAIPITNYWVKCTGDGYFIAFSNKIYPINLAKHIQNIKNQKRIKTRVALHTDRILSLNDLLNREDHIGPGINYVSRLLDLCGPGNIFCSENIIKELDIEIVNDKTGEDLGNLKIKHGDNIHAYNLFSKQYGNKNIPKLVKEQIKNRKASSANRKASSAK